MPSNANNITFNFRATSGYVTDGPGETYSLGAAYPEERLGWTFGWYNGNNATPDGPATYVAASNAGNTRDRNSLNDRRIAGLIFSPNSGGSLYAFRVNLPRAGKWNVRFTSGDLSNQQTHNIRIFDNTTQLFQLQNKTTSTSVFMGADGVTTYSTITFANSPAVSLTFTSTVMYFELGFVGTAGGTGNNSALNSLSLEYMGNDTRITQSSLRNLTSKTYGTVFDQVSTARGSATDSYSLATVQGMPVTNIPPSNKSVYYIDYEGGDDSKDGRSFANRRRTFSTDAIALQPGDELRYMASLDPVNTGVNGTWFEASAGLQGGSTLINPSLYTINSSTNATPIVVTLNQTIGTAPRRPIVAGDTVIIYEHFTNTNANGRWKVLSVGSNTVTLGHADGTNSSGNGVGSSGYLMRWSHHTVQLSAPVTKNLWVGNPSRKTAWTAATNVTFATSNSGSFDYNEDGSNRGVLVVDTTTFTTGKLGYFATGTLNLSAYQQLNLWVAGETFTFAFNCIPAGTIQICLCSDTAGNTPVDTINLPQFAASIGDVSIPLVLTSTTGANFGSSIQSIAFYATRPLGQFLPPSTTDFRFGFNCIFASKSASSADCLTLHHVIGKNTKAEPQWFNILSIDDNRVMLRVGMINGSISLTPGGYQMGVETVPLYARKPIMVTETIPVTSVQVIQAGYIDSAAYLNTITASGTKDAPITITGGWSRTDMSTRAPDAETWFGGYSLASLNGQINSSSSIFGITGNNLKVDGLNFSGLSSGIKWTGTGELGTHHSVYCATGPWLTVSGADGTVPFTIDKLNISNQYSTACYGSYKINEITLMGNSNVSLNYGVVTINTARLGSNLTGLSMAAGTIKNLYSNHNFIGLSATTSTGTVRVFSADVNYSSGAAFGPNTGKIIVQNLTSSNNVALVSEETVSGVGYSFHLNVKNWMSTNDTAALVMNSTNQGNIPKLFSQYEGKNVLVNKIYSPVGLMQSQSAVSQTNSYAWQLSPTTIGANEGNPLTLPVGSIYVKAGVAFTITADVQRDNTGLTMKLKAYNGQITGLSATLEATAAASAGVWETLTLTGTPTVAGVINIVIEAYGGTSYNGYVGSVSAN